MQLPLQGRVKLRGKKGGFNPAPENRARSNLKRTNSASVTAQRGTLLYLRTPTERYFPLSGAGARAHLHNQDCTLHACAQDLKACQWGEADLLLMWILRD